MWRLLDYISFKCECIIHGQSFHMCFCFSWWCCRLKIDVIFILYTKGNKLGNDIWPARNCATFCFSDRHHNMVKWYLQNKYTPISGAVFSSLGFGVHGGKKQGSDLFNLSLVWKVERFYFLPRYLIRLTQFPNQTKPMPHLIHYKSRCIKSNHQQVY